METIRTKEMNGHQVIVGLDKLTIDPEGTKAKAKELLKETDIYKEYIGALKTAEAAKKQIVEKREEVARRVIKIEKDLSLLEFPAELRISMANEKGSAHCKKYIASLKARNKINRISAVSMVNITKDLRKIIERVNATHRELLESTIVYFEPRKGEKIPTPKQLSDVKTAIGSLEKDEILIQAGNKIRVHKLPKE